ncbi:MAG: DNA repair protein RecO [Rhodospirillaceae bacterium]|nr:MAG: DNA repair protein RecO [Rhodospirillaceae bacterium]
MAVDWEDRGIVLSLRPHGEADAILTLLTEHRGRHAGLVRGGAGRRQRSVLQAGNLVQGWWRARLDSQLGTYTVEAIRSFAGPAMSAPIKLAGLAALCAMIDTTLPEREPHPGIFAAALELLEHLGDVAWNAHYVRWELALLREMGYGLDLRNCAATGQTAELAFVSPRSGRAVSRAAAAPYRDRLLTLPSFLIAPGDDGAGAGPEDIRAGLDLTGYFFSRNVFAPLRQDLPQARSRFIDLICR